MPKKHYFKERYPKNMFFNMFLKIQITLVEIAL